MMEKQGALKNWFEINVSRKAYVVISKQTSGQYKKVYINSGGLSAVVDLAGSRRAVAAWDPASKKNYNFIQTLHFFFLYYYT